MKWVEVNFTSKKPKRNRAELYLSSFKKFHLWVPSVLVFELNHYKIILSGSLGIG